MQPNLSLNLEVTKEDQQPVSPIKRVPMRVTSIGKQKGAKKKLNKEAIYQISL